MFGKSKLRTQVEVLQATNAGLHKQKERRDMEIDRLKKELEDAQLQYSELLLKVTDLKNTISDIELQKRDPRHVVQAIMAEDFAWYNNEELPFEQKVTYYNEAQSILRSNVFNNEKNYFISCWAKWALSNAKDFDGVRDMRMSVSALQLLEDRLKEIRNPHERKTEEEVYDAI